MCNVIYCSSAVTLFEFKNLSILDLFFNDEMICTTLDSLTDCTQQNNGLKRQFLVY